MTTPFLFNIALTLLWMMLNRDTTLLNGILGFALGAVVVEMTLRASARTTYLGRLWSFVRFACYFLYILVKANLDVAWEIITPGYSMKPRMIRYDVTGLTPIQVTTLANAITLTPGTLSADINDEGDTLYIHAMYAEKKADATKDLDELRDKLLKLVFHTNVKELNKTDA
ncbi:MAG: Na+/H+ antiporter subunit E [Phycisphaeraceae bacterium]|jgi:multicomponent Na+:H+ antiporter subunit E